jgi:uncharacterized protein YmfQ (DUF2313 family)
MIDNTNILELKKQLLPTGRAFKVPHIGSQNTEYTGIFENLLLGRGIKESEVYSDAVGILDSLIPDNNNFDVSDCSAWEKTLSISPAINLTDRKNAIYSKMQFPLNTEGRQHKNYLEYRLNQAGFICKVYEWNDISNYIVGLMHSTGTIHNSGTIHQNLTFPIFTQVVANYIDAEKEPTIVLNSLNINSFFWISGLAFNNPITITSDRIKEFRNIILQIKPVQKIGLIQTT